MSYLKLEQIDALPECGFHLPASTAYVALGCIGCENSVCLSAESRAGIFTALEHGELREARDLVTPNTTVYQGFLTEMLSDKCQNPCDRQDEIDTALALINETYGSGLERGAI